MNYVLERECGAARAGAVGGIAIGAAGFELKGGCATGGVNENDLVEGNGEVDDVPDAIGAVGGGGADRCYGRRRRGGIAREEGVAVYITNEQIEITVAIDIGEGRAGVVVNIYDSERIDFSIGIQFPGVSGRGGAWSCGVLKEVS